jgi:hypothetical protein
MKKYFFLFVFLCFAFGKEHCRMIATGVWRSTNGEKVDMFTPEIKSCDSSPIRAVAEKKPNVRVFVDLLGK